MYHDLVEINCQQLQGSIKYCETKMLQHKKTSIYPGVFKKYVDFLRYVQQYVCNSSHT